MLWRGCISVTPVMRAAWTVMTVIFSIISAPALAGGHLRVYEFRFRKKMKTTFFVLTTLNNGLYFAKS